MPDRRKKILTLLLIIIIAITLIVLAMPFLVSGQVEAIPVSFYFEQNIPSEESNHQDNVFTVMTLNIGHGRGNSLHQLLQSKKRITANANQITDVIKREKIDITALQEVDGPGFWNGGFDLIEYIAETSGYPHGIWTRNVETPALSYGTALLSELAYSHAESYTFRAKPFILPKGFTTGIFRISENSNIHVCIASVHLAPLLAPMRRLQTEIIIKSLENINYPIVITGDFNCGYKGNSAVKMIAERLNLKMWKPESKELGTHHPGKRRLDWILISENLEFIDYSVLDDNLSDHSAVKAAIRYKKTPGNK